MNLRCSGGAIKIVNNGGTIDINHGIYFQPINEESPDGPSLTIKSKYGITINQGIDVSGGQVEDSPIEDYAVFRPNAAGECGTQTRAEGLDRLKAGQNGGRAGKIEIDAEEGFVELSGSLWAEGGDAGAGGQPYNWDRSQGRCWLSSLLRSTAGKRGGRGGEGGWISVTAGSGVIVSNSVHFSVRGGRGGRGSNGSSFTSGGGDGAEGGEGGKGGFISFANVAFREADAYNWPAFAAEGGDGEFGGNGGSSALGTSSGCGVHSDQPCVGGNGGKAGTGGQGGHGGEVRLSLAKNSIFTPSINVAGGSGGMGGSGGPAGAEQDDPNDPNHFRLTAAMDGGAGGEGGANGSVTIKNLAETSRMSRAIIITRGGRGGNGGEGGLGNRVGIGPSPDRSELGQGGKGGNGGKGASSFDQLNFECGEGAAPYLVVDNNGGIGGAGGSAGLCWATGGKKGQDGMVLDLPRPLCNGGRIDYVARSSLNSDGLSSDKLPPCNRFERPRKELLPPEDRR